MKELLVYADLRTEVCDSPRPVPRASQIVVRVHAWGSNPQDWKTWWVPQLPINMGDDRAGTVYAVGEGVVNFKVSNFPDGF